jgi:hypothetical protein
MGSSNAGWSDGRRYVSATLAGFERRARRGVPPRLARGPRSPPGPSSSVRNPAGRAASVRSRPVRSSARVSAVVRSNAADSSKSGPSWPIRRHQGAHRRASIGRPSVDPVGFATTAIAACRQLPRNPRLCCWEQRARDVDLAGPPGRDGARSWAAAGGMTRARSNPAAEPPKAQGANDPKARRGSHG